MWSIDRGILSHGLDQLWLACGNVEQYQRRPVRCSPIRLPRLDQFRADVQIAREHRLRRVQRCTYASDGAAVQRFWGEGKRGRAEAPLALSVSKGFVRGREEFGKRFVLHDTHSFGESVALICATTARNAFFCLAVNVLASFLPYTNIR